MNIKNLTLILMAAGLLSCASSTEYENPIKKATLSSRGDLVVIKKVAKPVEEPITSEQIAVEPLAPTVILPKRVATVNFDLNSVEIDALNKIELNGVKEQFENAPEDTVIIVEGHADRTGPANYNQMIAQERAERVRDYLVIQGLPFDYIFTKSFGEEVPVVENANWTDNRLNRRVEVKLINRADINFDDNYAITLSN